MTVIPYITDNVIVGNGEVPAVRTKEGLEWVLPTGERTRDRAKAEAYAYRLDQIITPNLHRYRRKIMKG